MGRVAVVDYGMGNLLSVTRALEQVDAEPALVSTPEQVLAAERVVLPGVGAFADGMAGLEQRELVEPLRAYAASGRPLLGLCLGLHMLMEESEEFGTTRGLGILGGRVRPLEPAPDAKVPHVGWAALARPPRTSWDGSLLERLDPGASVYFTHSLAVEPADGSVVVAEASHGDRPFAAVVERGAVGGTQFHPEKSGPVGLAILARFVAG